MSFQLIIYIIYYVIFWTDIWRIEIHSYLYTYAEEEKLLKVRLRGLLIECGNKSFVFVKLLYACICVPGLLQHPFLVRITSSIRGNFNVTWVAPRTTSQELRSRKMVWQYNTFSFSFAIIAIILKSIKHL